MPDFYSINIHQTNEILADVANNVWFAMYNMYFTYIEIEQFTYIEIEQCKAPRFSQILHRRCPDLAWTKPQIIHQILPASF